jgi:outer membrane protein TolC
VTLRDVLDARRDALDAQLMTARATAGQYQSVADLMFWSGLESFESLIPLSNEPTLHADH